MKANDLEIYNREAKHWWTPGSPLNVLHSMNPPRFSFFDRFIKDWKNLKVLDVGCGGGFTSEFLAQRGAQVTGIDLSSATIESAREHAKTSHLKIDYLVGSGEDLPLPAGHFDVVICVDVLEHVSDLPKTLSEIHRVLKPGGSFLFDTINRTFKAKAIMIWLLERILRHIPNGTHDWKMFIRPEELSQALTNTGFSSPELAGFEVQGVDKKAGKSKASIGRDMSVMYIGQTTKPRMQ